MPRERVEQSWGCWGGWRGAAGGAGRVVPMLITRFLRAALFPGSAERMRCDHKLEITQTDSALCHFPFC